VKGRARLAFDFDAVVLDVARDRADASGTTSGGAAGCGETGDSNRSTSPG